MFIQNQPHFETTEPFLTFIIIWKLQPPEMTDFGTSRYRAGDRSNGTVAINVNTGNSQTNKVSNKSNNNH